MAETEILLAIRDKRGLMDALGTHDGFRVSYVDSRLNSLKVGQGFAIGALVPFEDTRTTILETLNRYDHIKYYGLSTDFINRPHSWHLRTVIGTETNTDPRAQVQPIDPATMIRALEKMNASEDLATFVRSNYPAEYKIWPIDGAESLGELFKKFPVGVPPIHISERKVNDQSVNRPVLTIGLSAASPEAFLDKMEHVKKAYLDWLVRNRDDAWVFRLEVAAEEEHQAKIDRLIKAIYHEDASGKALQAVDFLVTIKNDDWTSDIKFGLLASSATSTGSDPGSSFLWSRLRGKFPGSP